MNWFDWIIVAVWMGNIIGVIARIGVRPDPITKESATGVVVVMLLMIVGLLWSHGVFT